MPALECVEVGRTAVVGWVDKRDWFLGLCGDTCGTLNLWDFELLGVVWRHLWDFELCLFYMWRLEGLPPPIISPARAVN